MRHQVGLWIDHRKALIVTLTPGGETKELVVSGVEKQRGRIDGVRSTTPFESQRVPADDRQERRLKARYDAFYDAVIERVGGAESILIVGPGEAKGELSKRLRKHALGGLIVGIETSAKLTDGQIGALVREHFLETGDGK